MPCSVLAEPLRKQANTSIAQNHAYSANTAV
jgi:hypothetical protein